jgi:TP901 family phage tail tape measure protein
MAERRLKMLYEGDISGILGSLKTLAATNLQTFSTMSGAALGATAVTVAAVAGVGVAAFKVGEKFDEAYDAIRVGTGATGTALDGLKDSFKNVIKDVPTDFGSASTAIADLNTRLGLTGPELEHMAAQQLELARITKTDLAGNIASTTRVFGDWSVATEEQSGKLDLLFRASQATGIEVGALADLMVQFGAPMREFGFSFDEAAALMANFERSGVNTELVMGGLKIGLGKLASEGKDARAELLGLMGSIEESGMTAENKTKVFELFGRRAGIDMAKAIEEGRFSIGDLVAELEGSSETILKAGEDTADLGEKWTEFKNKALVFVEPFATGVFNVVVEVLTGILDAIGRVGEVWDFVTGLWQAGTAAIAGDTEGTFARIQEIISLATEAIKTIIATALGLIKGVWERWGADIMAFLQTAWGAIQNIFDAALRVINGILDVFIGVFTGDWTRVWEGVKGIFGGIVDGIKGMFDLWLGALKLAFKVFGDIFEDAWKGLWNAVKDFFSGWKDAVVAKGNEAIDWLKGLPGKILDAIGNLGTLLWDAGAKLLQGLIDGIKAKLTALKNTLGDIKDKIVSWKGPLTADATLLTPAGEAIMSGLTDSIRSQIPDLRAAIRAVSREIALVGPPALAAVGAEAVRSQRPIAHEGAAVPSSAGHGSPTPLVVVVELDGREIARTTRPYLIQTGRRNPDIFGGLA